MRGRRIAALFVAVFLSACGPSSKQLDRDYAAVRLAIWRGDFAEAGRLASDDIATLSPDKDPDDYWRFSLLSAEVAISQRDFSTAGAVVHARLPDSLAAGALGARQRLLEAKLAADQGHLQAAHEILTAARRQTVADADLALEVDRLDGQILVRLGQRADGEALLNSVVAAAAAQSNEYQQATALNDLGMSRFVRSRFDEALPYFERVIAIPALNQLQIYALALKNAGSCYQHLGQFDKALALQQRAFAMQEHRGKREEFVKALVEMGNLYALQSQPERALPFFQRGLDEARAANLPASIAKLDGNICSVEIDLGRWDDAERHNEEFHKIWMADHTEPSVYYLLNRGSIAKGRGRLDEADQFLREALTVEGASPSVQWSSHYNLAQVATERRDRARASNEYEAALRIIETTRASLAGTDAKISYLTELISFYRGYVSALLEQGEDDRALEVADSSRGQLLAERQGVSSPGRAKMAGFRQAARQSGAVILSYWLSVDRSYLWVVAPDGVHLLSLPPLNAIDALVRQHQANIANVMSSPLAAANGAGDKLYETLIAPAGAWIPRDTRVVIIPDGPLHEINFETLTVPSPIRHYWIDDVQVELAPSLAALSAAVPQQDHRGSGLLLVGNARAHNPDFPSLANASLEMSNIASHFGPDAVTTLEGDGASPRAYAGARPERFKYVHFTAHATANRDNPLDSIVVLSGPQDGYKLYAREVATLKLNADLVTISACRSAGDKAYAGEGLVGFSWAFLKAGAHNVVAGLWDVDDSTTPQLMDRFYAGITAGHTPGRALRDAKRAMIADGGAAAAPYRWAALELFTASLQ
jgi:CHAT domain-containing protein